MIYLYLARHGETVWNTMSRMQGRENSELTPNGLAGARRLAEALAGVPLMAAFTSPAGRAVETARLALAGRPVPLIADERIHEMALGHYEGLTVAEAYTLDRENADAFFHHADRYVAVGGEGFTDVMERIAGFLDELAADPVAMVCRYLDAMADDPAPDTGLDPMAGAQDDQHILIVSHNITVKVMLAIIRQIPLERLRDGRSIPQAQLIPVAFDPASRTYRLLPEAERLLQ